jgi:hypothetical protein
MVFNLITRRVLDDELANVLRAVRLAGEEQERHIKTIRLEWEEWFDKFRRLYMRLNKRARDGAVADSDEEQGQAPKGPSGAAPLPRLEEAKAAWRARRGLA